MRWPEEDWPTKSNVRNDIVLPEVKQRFVGTIQTTSSETLLGRFDIHRFSKWRLLINTTARILNLYSWFKKTNNLEYEIVKGTYLEQAEKLWIQEAQKDMDLKKID